MNGKAQINGLTASLVSLVVAIVVLVVGIIIVQSVNDTLPNTENLATTDTFLENVNVENTLTQVPSIWTSATVKNQTWLEFDGVDDYIEVENVGLQNINSNFTIIGFVSKNFANNPEVLHIYDSNNNSDNYDYRYYMQWNDAGNYFRCWANDKLLSWGLAGSIDSHFYANQINDTDKHMFVCVGNVNSFNAYIDEMRQREDESIINISGSTRNPRIGRDTGSIYLNGSIYEVRIYNKSLEHGDIWAIQNNSEYGKKRTKPLLIVNYHGVYPGCTTGSCTNVTLFTSHMAFYNSSNYTTISYKNWSDYLSTGIDNLPDKPIIFSFDDYSKSVFTNATPIMNEYGFTGSFALNTRELDDGGAGDLNWSDAQNMSDIGWEFISHGIHHWNATQVLESPISNITSFFNDSRWEIKNNLSLGELTVAFVYPWSIWNETTDEICQEYYEFCIHDYASSESPNYNFVETSGNTTLRRMVVGNTAQVQIDRYNDIYLTTSNIEDYLVGQWRLNENTGTTAYDVSGNGNNGTITGATWADDGVDLTLTNRTDYTIVGTTFVVNNSDYAWSEVITSYSWLGSPGSAKSSINGSIVGLGTFADFIPIIVIALAASIIIGLVLIGFAFGGRQR